MLRDVNTRPSARWSRASWPKRWASPPPTSLSSRRARLGHPLLYPRRHLQGARLPAWRQTRISWRRVIPCSAPSYTSSRCSLSSPRRGAVLSSSPPTGSCGRSSSWVPPLFITFSEIPMKTAFWDEWPAQNSHFFRWQKFIFGVAWQRAQLANG